MDQNRPKTLSPSDRLPLTLLAKTLDHQAASEPSKLNRDRMTADAKTMRELAMKLPGKPKA